MMRVSWFIMLVCMLTNFVSSQSILPVFYDTVPHEGKLEVFGGAFYHTSSIQNRLGDKFVFGGHISEEDKDASYEKMEDFNTLGGDISNHITFYGKDTLSVKYPDLSWKVSFETSTVFGAEFNKDVFSLLMYGNQYFANKNATANLNRTYGFYFSGTKLGVGVYNRKTKSSFALNAVIVNNYWKLAMDRGSFKTKSNGDDVFALANGEVGFTGADFYNGMGVSFDFNHYIPIRTEGLMSGFVQVSARNFGVAQVRNWKSTTLEGTLSFNGFNFSSLMEDTGDSFVNQVQDSLGVRSSVGHTWIVMPGVFQVGKIVDAHSEKKLQSFFGARAYLTTVYRPMVYFGLHYGFTKNFSAGSQIAYGGFGGFRMGMYASYTLNDKLAISLGTEDALGALHSRQYGQSVLLGINWKF